MVKEELLQLEETLLASVAHQGRAAAVQGGALIESGWGADAFKEGWMKKDNRPMILKGFIVPDYATLSIAPTKTERNGLHWEIIVGIGSDHVAFITIDDEALKALQDGEHVDIR